MLGDESLLEENREVLAAQRKIKNIGRLVLNIQNKDEKFKKLNKQRNKILQKVDDLSTELSKKERHFRTILSDIYDKPPDLLKDKFNPWIQASDQVEREVIETLDQLYEATHELIRDLNFSKR